MLFEKGWMIGWPTLGYIPSTILNGYTHIFLVDLKGLFHKDPIDLDLSEAGFRYPILSSVHLLKKRFPLLYSYRVVTFTLAFKR